MWLWSKICGGKREAIIKTFTFFSPEDQILSHRQQNTETRTVQLFSHKAYWLLKKGLQAVTMQKMWEPCVCMRVCL